MSKTQSSRSLTASRCRLRAVRPGESVPVPDFLPPGATWMPVPGHSLPAVAGQPPMVGYLVLVPADQVMPAGFEEATAPDRDADPVDDTAIHLDPDRRTAVANGHTLDLTYLEFELLAHLLAHPHRVHTRDELVTRVWGYGHVGDGRTVDVHVARLRRKLGPVHRASIVTVRRVGYKYVPVAAD